MATAEMQNTLVPLSTQPITYEFTKAEIIRVVEGAKMLRVTGVADEVGREKCRTERMKLAKMRNTVERERKAQKADVLERGRLIDSTAKELIAPIEDGEKYLESQEAIVLNEQKRLAALAEEKRQAGIRERLRMLSEAGGAYSWDQVEKMTDSQFGATLQTERNAKNERDEQAKAEAEERARVAEANRIEADRLATERATLERQRREQEAAAAEARRIENEKLAAERAEIERVKAEQAAAQAKIDADRKRLADEEAERTRLVELEKAKAAAAEKARVDAIAEQERKAQAEREHLAAVEAENKRRAALLPDHEKLLAVAAAVEAITVPNVSNAAKSVAHEIDQHLRHCVNGIRSACAEMINAK